MFDSLPKIPGWVFMVFTTLAIIGACAVVGFTARFLLQHLHLVWK